MLILGLSWERRGAIWSLSSESDSSEEGADASRTISSTTWSDAFLDSEVAVAIRAFRFQAGKYKILQANWNVALVKKKMKLQTQKPLWNGHRNRQWLERDVQEVLVVDLIIIWLFTRAHGLFFRNKIYLLH